VRIFCHTTLEPLQCLGNDVALHKIAKLVVQNCLHITHIRSACGQKKSFQDWAAIIGNEIASLDDYHARAIHVRELGQSRRACDCRHDFAGFTPPARPILSQLSTFHGGDGNTLGDIETANAIALATLRNNRNWSRLLVHNQRTACACVQNHENGECVTPKATDTFTPKVPEIAFHIPLTLRLYNTRLAPGVPTTLSLD